MNILKAYSDLSIKHGIITPESLVSNAKENGFKAIALTDFMNMFGFLRFYKSCLKENIKPILGVELLIKHPILENYKILVYAKTNIGLKNIFNILSLAYTKYGQESETKEPFLPHDFYKLYPVKDIIFTNGGIDGFFGMAIRKNREDLLLEIFTEQQLLFEDYYLEINRFSTENYYSKNIINKYNEVVINFYKKYNAKFIFTNPIMFLKIEDYDSHLIRVSSNRSIPLNSEIFSASVKDYYSQNMFFLTKENLLTINDDIYEIEKCFSDELVDLCNVNIETGKNYLPKFKTPNNETEEDYFINLSKVGLEKRLVQNNISLENENVYKDRLNFEINVILQMGFVGYFLIVQDFINWAKENDIPVGPGRGSGAGSLVAYSLGITDLDPLPYDLLFERFLNPERVSMPDFDIDFCQERRGEVILYVQNKYGKDAVAQIMTTGTMASKSVIKDVARALGKPLGLANSIANKVDPMVSLIDSYNDINNNQNGLMELIRGDDEAAQIWEHSLKLEGLTKSVGKHAAGVLIAPNKIIDFCPLYQVDDVPISQLDKNDVEAVGLVKFDFLGLRNLTIIKNAIKMIKENHNIDLKFNEDFTDIKTYELLQRGNTTGVFQLESSGMKKYLMRLKPACFEDIVAILALYRPGPLGSGMVDAFIKRKAWERDGKISRATYYDEKYQIYLKSNKPIGRDEFESKNASDFDKQYEITNYFTKELEECLKPTYGVIVYQEQVMKISQIIAGYSLGGADLLRRCVSGKSEIDIDGIGMIKIEDLYNKHKFNINQYKTATLNELNYKIENDKINDIFLSGTKETFKVKTSSGREFNITKDHEILTFDGWKTLEKFNINEDFIGLPTKLILNTKICKNYSNEALKIIAYVIGDGYINKKQMKNSYFCNSDKSVIDDFLICYTKLFNYTPKIRVQKKGLLKDVYYVPFNIQAQNWFLKNIKCSTSEFKEIPNFVFNLNRNQLILFISTLWSTDGSFDKKIGHCDYNSKSLKLIKQLTTLLLKLNIFAKVETRKINYNKITQKFYRCQITGKIDCMKFYDIFNEKFNYVKNQFAQECKKLIQNKITTSSKHDLPKKILTLIHEEKQFTNKSWNSLGLSNLIGGLNFSKPNRKISRNKVLKFGNKLNSDELVKIANSEILWDKIISIESNGIENVYDISMDKNYNFIIDNVFVHNCMGKKKPEEMAQQRDVFKDGALKCGYDLDLAMKLFDLMESFAEYGFNKSHSAGYAVITYQTAYLKAHYPSEFMAATLQSENEDTDKLEILIKDCYRNNIMVVPPSINESKEYFSVNKKGQVVYGLVGLKKISNEGIKLILEERDLNGKYVNFNDFIQRNFFTIGKGVLESLILSGCFDCFDLNINRGVYYNAIDDIMSQKRKLNSKSKKAELFLKEDFIKTFKISDSAYLIENNLSEYEMAKKEKLFIGYELVHSAYEALSKSISELSKDEQETIDSLKENGVVHVYSPTSLQKELNNFKIQMNTTIIKKMLISGEIEQTPHFDDYNIRIFIKDLKESLVCYLDKSFEMQWFKQHKEMMLEGRVVYFKANVEITNDSTTGVKVKKVLIEKFIDLINFS